MKTKRIVTVKSYDVESLAQLFNNVVESVELEGWQVVSQDLISGISNGRPMYYYNIFIEKEKEISEVKHQSTSKGISNSREIMNSRYPYEHIGGSNKIMNERNSSLNSSNLKSVERRCVCSPVGVNLGSVGVTLQDLTDSLIGLDAGVVLVSPTKAR